MLFASAGLNDFGLSASDIKAYALNRHLKTLAGIIFDFPAISPQELNLFFFWTQASLDQSKLSVVTEVTYITNMRLDQPLVHNPILQKQLQLLQRNGLDQVHILPEILVYSVRNHLCFTRCDDVPKVTQGEYRRTMLSLSVHELRL